MGSVRHGLMAMKRSGVWRLGWAGILALTLLWPLDLMPGARAGNVSFKETGARRFTVRDSIEMSRFGRVDYEPVPSPDGRYTAVVTSRGSIRNDEVESTLRVFSTSAIRKGFGREGNSVDLASRVVARFAATPQAIYDASYEPIISSVQWAHDSSGLLFLVQNTSGKRQIYRAALGETKAATAVTPPDQDVTEFDSSAGTIAYRVERRPHPGRGEPINQDAWDVTGLTLRTILFPKDQTNLSRRNSTLWFRREGRNRPVLDPVSHTPFRLWNYPPPIWNPLSISPDGTSVVALLPVDRVPSSWERYPAGSTNLVIHPGDPRLVSESNPSRLTEYGLIDLTTGRYRPIVNAPNGWAVGYSIRNRAAWFPDGHSVLVTDTFLAFDGSKDPLHTHPCAAAVVNLVGGETECLSYRDESLFRISFSQTGSEVRLWFFGEDEPERYRLRDGSWRRETLALEPSREVPPECSGSRASTDGSSAVYVKEGLNEPPSLWATDCTTERSIEIWNPNPQLAEVRLGEASVIRWKDESGYEWKAALLLPPDYVAGKRYPLIIQAYGFAENEFLADGEFTTAFAARPLAAAGMIVLSIEERVDHVLTPEEAPDQIRGFESAIHKLSADGLIDPDRVGLIGFSRTCYYVESALIRHPNDFAAAAIADGIDESYLQYLLFSAVRPPLEPEGEEIYGTGPFGRGLAAWVDEAPGFRLDRIETPLRIQAIGPASVLFEWEIYASLYRQGKPEDLVYFPRGQHILQRPLDRMASQQGDVDWFRFWLNGEEDRDPSKVREYSLWRAIRDRYLKDKRGREASH